MSLPHQQSRIAHLVVDMQDYWLTDLAPEDQDLPRRIENFVDQSAQHFFPIYVTTPTEEEGGRSAIRELKTWAFKPGEVQQAESVSKMMSSGFRYKMCGNIVIPSDLDRILKKRDIDTVIISGVNMRCCVWETALDAVTRGYKTHIIADLCADSRAFKRSSNFPEITENYAAANGINLIHTTHGMDRIAALRAQQATPSTVTHPIPGGPRVPGL